ncbi:MULTISPECIES: hypothetical protein [Maribellus]|uniref:Uncharacterized protein n=1 Tax=Maribellus comscasis TaxID=2681766 RepID=A0A6I6JPP6_9BACT|nr:MULTISPECIES: hypothetical protein [Maribellus]MCG6185767.1 hypothetical protein [Maribellus maritimus]QGY43028.1 hypothetical protein GM418_04950 [Maribellus comscasis]
MALGKAIKFVKQIGVDNELRKSCYKYNSKEELLKKLDFNEGEFEDAINMELVKCQTYEQAERFQQLKMWFLIL